jgi:ABC-type sulfate transport system substrate-binding protein
MNHIINDYGNSKYEFTPIPPVDILIIEVPFSYDKENIEKIKKDVVNPYIIFVYNPNLKEVRTQYIKTN